MVFMLCLTGKTQRFANCKVCASLCACCHSVCTLKKKKCSIISPERLEIELRQRYHPEKDSCDEVMTSI